MKTRKLFLAGALAAAAILQAQEPNPRRDAYRQQMLAQEVERLAAQFSLLNENVDAVAGRLSRLENKPSADSALRDEIAALKASIAEIKRKQDAMRSEIVADISAKVAKMIADSRPKQPAQPPPKPPKPGKDNPPPAGDCYQYTIEQGQTLYDIAQAYGTTVKKIVDANPGIKPNALRIGQKILRPAE